jgi:hypothetical protein
MKIADQRRPLVHPSVAAAEVRAALPLLSSREVVPFLDCFTVNEGWVPHCPDFLRRLVALIHSMRLNERRTRGPLYVAGIGVKPGFGFSGIPQH